MEQQNKLYSTTEVAAQLKISAVYLRVILQRKPELTPALKIAGAWLWTDKEIERFSTQHKRRGAPA